MSRRRYRRPTFLPVFLTAVLVGVLVHTGLTQFTGMHGNAAAMLGFIAGGVVFGRRIRLPSIRITWRRR